MVRRLNKIVKLTDADVVVSSSWRILYDIQMLQVMLFNQGMTWAHKVVGKTKDFTSCRGSEIKDYLDTHDKYDVYCILDDETDMLDEQKPFFIRTDWDVGLSEEDVSTAIRILGQSRPMCKTCNGYGFHDDGLCTCRRDGIKDE